MQLAFVLYKYFPFGGLQRDFMRIALECQQRGHQIRVYTMIWENSAVQKTVMVFSHSTILRTHQRARVLTITLTMVSVSDLI